MTLRLEPDAVWQCGCGRWRAKGATCCSPAPVAPQAPIKARAISAPGEATLWLTLPVKGKARARVYQDEAGESRARKPAHYAEWLRNARRQFQAQWAGRPTLERLERLDVVFWGGSRANDGDNGVGSVMDAMVKAGVVVQDNLKRIPRGSWDWQPSETPRIEVRIKWA